MSRSNHVRVLIALIALLLVSVSAVAATNTGVDVDISDIRSKNPAFDFVQNNIEVSVENSGAADSGAVNVYLYKGTPDMLSGNGTYYLATNSIYIQNPGETNLSSPSYGYDAGSGHFEFFAKDGAINLLTSPDDMSYGGLQILLTADENAGDPLDDSGATDPFVVIDDSGSLLNFFYFYTGYNTDTNEKGIFFVTSLTSPVVTNEPAALFSPMPAYEADDIGYSDPAVLYSNTNDDYYIFYTEQNATDSRIGFATTYSGTIQSNFNINSRNAVIAADFDPNHLGDEDNVTDPSVIELGPSRYLMTYTGWSGGVPTIFAAHSRNLNQWFPIGPVTLKGAGGTGDEKTQNLRDANLYLLNDAYPELGIRMDLIDDNGAQPVLRSSVITYPEEFDVTAWGGTNPYQISNIAAGGGLQKATFPWKPALDDTGSHYFTARAVPVNGDDDMSDNFASVYTVNVAKKERTKAAFIASSGLVSVFQAIGMDDSLLAYDVEVDTFTSLPADLSQYDVILFESNPGAYDASDASALQTYVSNDGGVVFMGNSPNDLDLGSIQGWFGTNSLSTIDTVDKGLDPVATTSWDRPYLDEVDSRFGAPVSTVIVDGRITGGSQHIPLSAYQVSELGSTSVPLSFWDNGEVFAFANNPWSRGRVFYLGMGPNTNTLELEDFFIRGVLWASRQSNLTDINDAVVAAKNIHPSGFTGQPEIGETIYFNVSVSNNGNAPIVVDITGYRNVESPAGIIGSHTGQSIGSGSIVQFPFSWVAVEDGDNEHDFIFVVDPDGTLLELREDNNRAVKTIEVFVPNELPLVDIDQAEEERVNEPGLTGSSSDPNGQVIVVRVKVGDGEWDDAVPRAVGDWSTWSYPLNPSKFVSYTDNTRYTFEVQSHDNDLDPSPSSWVNLTVDLNDKPRVEPLGAGGDRSITRGNPLTMRFDVTDEFPDTVTLDVVLNTPYITVAKTPPQEPGDEWEITFVPLLGALLGSYTTQVIPQDAIGVTGDPYEFRIEVENNPPTPVITTTSTTVSLGDEITLSGATSDDLEGVVSSYMWYVDDGQGLYHSTSFIKHTFVNDGQWDVVLNVTDNEGASNESVLVITVVNEPPVARYVVPSNYLPDKIYYREEGQNGLFDASPTTDSPRDLVGLTYEWDYGDGTDPVVENGPAGARDIHYFMHSGFYTVTLTVTDDDGESSTDVMNVSVVNRPPEARIGTSTSDEGVPLLGNRTVMAGTEVTFDGTGSVDSTNDLETLFYEWTFRRSYNGDATTESNITTRKIIFNERGQYAQTLRVTDDDNVSHETTIWITVIQELKFKTPRNDALVSSEVFIELTDIANIEKVEVSYFHDSESGVSRGEIITFRNTPFRYTWNLENDALPIGIYTLEAKAYDAGDVISEAKVRVKIGSGGGQIDPAQLAAAASFGAVTAVSAATVTSSLGSTAARLAIDKGKDAVMEFGEETMRKRSDKSSDEATPEMKAEISRLLNKSFLSGGEVFWILVSVFLLASLFALGEMWSANFGDSAADVGGVLKFSTGYDHLVFTTLFPIMALTAGLVIVLLELVETSAARVQGVASEYKMWGTGIFALMISTVFFWAPFGFPGKGRIAPGQDIPTENRALMALAKLFLLLALLFPFTLILMFATNETLSLVGTNGVGICLALFFYASLPASPLEGHEVKKWNPGLSYGLLGIAVAFLFSWELSIGAGITSIPLGVYTAVGGGAMAGLFYVLSRLSSMTRMQKSLQASSRDDEGKSKKVSKGFQDIDVPAGADPYAGSDYDTVDPYDAPVAGPSPDDWLNLPYKKGSE